MSNRDFSEAGPSKKRRLPGACDMCKKRKIRCDSCEKPNGQCTNCTNSKIECTHVELTKNLGSARGYVESLELRLEKMELLLNKLLPGVDISNELDSDSPDHETLPQPTEDSLPRNDLEEVEFKLEKLTLKNAYYGKASGLYLVETALQHKKQHTGKEVPKIAMKHDDKWTWEPPPMGAFEIKQPTYEFPDDDLLRSLVNLYFEHYNSYLPLLHRPTTEQSIARREHLHDTAFGGVLMLMCALGARFSNDARVFSSGPQYPNSAGWHYMSQVPVVSIIRGKPTLADLQIYALATSYLKSCSTSYIAWIFAGFGIRLAQEIGAQSRRGRESSPPNATDELIKRAFFVLLYHDRTMSAFVGRPPAIREDEYDIDPPLSVDDEFWEADNPKLNFKQPLSIPSTIEFFRQNIVLNDIMSYAQRAIYSLRKPCPVTGKFTDGSDHQTITSIDSALNNWLSSVPDFLKWDPNRPKDLFYKQSAMLLVSFHGLQIFIHKPFIPTPERPSALSFPSLTICTSAARTISRIAKVMHTNTILLPLPHVFSCYFLAAIVLLLNSWTGSRSGRTGNTDRDREDVNALLETMRGYAGVWPNTLMLVDFILDLAHVSQQPMSGVKRRRSSEFLGGEGAAARPTTTQTRMRNVGGSHRPTSRVGSISSSSSGSTASLSSQGVVTPPMTFSTLGASTAGLSSLSNFNFSPELPNFPGDFSSPTSSSNENSPYAPGNLLSFSPEFGAINGTGSMNGEGLQGFNSLFDLTPQPPVIDPMSVWSTAPLFGTDVQDWAPFLASFGQVDQTFASGFAPDASKTQTQNVSRTEYPAPHLW